MTDTLEKFMNIWEVERNFKCPVVGAMLSVEKHKNILKKCGYDVKALKPYEYHSYIMGCMGDENAVSIKVNNYIRHQARKYMVEIAALYDKGDKAGVRQLWNSYSREGCVGPVMYAIVAHEDTSVQLLQDIHGEVHMLAHANMTEVFLVRKNLRAMEEALGRERRQAGEKAGQIRELVKARKSDARSMAGLARENQALKRQVQALDARTAESSSQTAEERIARLEKALEKEKDQARILEREKKQLQIHRFSLENENALIRKELQELVDSLGREAGAVPGICPDCPDCPESGICTDEACPNYSLCAKRVFMIGGITKMKAHYKAIVEKAGGCFDYHDGYMKNANANLAAKVRRCDMVICPVSCNSHNACLRVKKLCNRYNKELKILNSASLSAVTQALLAPQAAN